MVKYDVEGLYNILQSFIGKEISILESITRDRKAGHDRHFATSTGFRMIPKSVSWSLSGANFHLDGAEGFTYGLSSEHVVRFSVNEKGHLIIVEQFENKTERETTIKVAPVPAGG